MELHRLKEMPENYNPELFNSLYEKTKQLRNSLSYQIDHRRLGVTQDEIKSWFSDKFMFAYCKYFEEFEENILLGHIIKSLQFFKCRILRKVYQESSSLYSNEISLDNVQLSNIIEDETEMGEKEVLMNLALEFMKNKISNDAYQLLTLELQPPIYITSRIASTSSRIPNKLILEFLGVPYNQNTQDYIKGLREEIQTGISNAREYFSQVSI